MLIITLSFNFICILIVYESSVTSEIIKDSGKLSIINETLYERHKNNKSSKSNEIGTVQPITMTNVKVPTDKLDILLSLDSEMGNSKKKSIVPRKEAPSSFEDDQVLQNSTERNAFDVPKDIKNPQESIHDLINRTSSGKGKIANVSLTTKVSSDKDITQNTKIPEVPKKPLILSNEVLDKIILVETNQSYLKDNHVTKVPKNPNGHPDIIMPIVITMLVVPMFAVIGYLAVKRGQEAWKNRHYKRMDFLLDGMYND